MQNDVSRIVEALPGLVWTAHADGCIDYLNQRWCEYTGLGVEEACGRGWQVAIHPQDLAGLLHRWQTILASGKPGEMEARLRRFDGEYRWFLFRTNPLANASGQIVKWCGIVTDIADRRQAEEELRAQKRRFQLIVEGLPAQVSIRSPAGDLQHVNRQFLEYSGATLEQLKSRSWHDTWHPDDRPASGVAWTKALETGQPYEFEGRRRRADGVHHWFHVRGFPLRDDDGRIVLWYLMHTDVDDRKRAEALLAGEKRLVEMVAGSHSMPAILDALCQVVESTASGCHCSVVLVDQSGTRLERGAAPSLPAGFISSIIGQPVNVEPGPCAMAARLNQQVIVPDLTLETQWAEHAWYQIVLAHGLRACWSTPISSKASKVLGAFAIYFDEPKTPTPLDQSLIEQFTHIASIAIERTQSDAALKRSEAFLAETRRISMTGGFSTRLATGEIFWSDEVYRMFEFERGVPLTRARILTRVHPDDVQSFYEMLAWQRRGIDYQHGFRLLMPDQSVKYLHVDARATHDHDGGVEYIAAVQDVTQRHLAEEAIARARSELARVAGISSLGALTASIAHEVNQPLSGIITNASTCLRMLAADPPNVDGARETARRTIRDGNRASEVIARLRALFGKRDATIEPVDLNEAAREVIALSLSELQRNRVILGQEFDDTLPTITGDRVQLQQVILNLLLNASDAMNGIDDRPRRLVIRTEWSEGDCARLSVRDAGVGFEPQNADRLFDAFYTTKNGGMGIGLYVSRSIIESHRGRLWATPNDGPGATFLFSIPLRPEGAKGAWSTGAMVTAAFTDPQHGQRSL